MDENRVAGTACNVGGKVEEGFGRVTGNTRMQTEGLVDQAAGAAQDLYGQARDSAADAAGAARDRVASHYRDAALYKRHCRHWDRLVGWTDASSAVTCDLCDDTGWVCEDHGDRPPKDDSDRADACAFGAGMPCPRCNRDSRHVGQVPRLPPGMRVMIDHKPGPRH